MGTALTIYWASFVFGALFLLLLGVLGHFGGHDAGGHDIGGHDVGGHDIGGHDVGGHDAGGHGAAGHADGGGAHGPASPSSQFSGISPLSPLIISCFLTIFGATGIACASIGVPPLISAPLASVSALVISALAFVAFSRLLMRIQSTSHYALHELEGLEGTVVTPIPASGVGEVAVVAHETRRTNPARSADGSAIEKHVTVVVERVVGNTLMVRKAIDERLRELRPEGPSA
ncbi:MAG TPA: NfeD family protein [Armatimonadota bacterium]|nr:NfeD family protein [Armatimonadota bacterium]HQK96287.1 NfeD family protein [Armatimonadota bacterium]